MKCGFVVALSILIAFTLIGGYALPIVHADEIGKFIYALKTGEEPEGEPFIPWEANPDKLEVRIEAAARLGESADERALSPLLDVLENEYKDWQLRNVVVKALKNFQDESDKEIISSRLQWKFLPLLKQEKDSDTQQCIINLLGEFGDEESMPLLKAFTREPVGGLDTNRHAIYIWVRDSALAAIKRIESHMNQKDSVDTPQSVVKPTAKPVAKPFIAQVVDSIFFPIFILVLIILLALSFLFGPKTQSAIAKSPSQNKKESRKEIITVEAVESEPRAQPQKEKKSSQPEHKPADILQHYMEKQNQRVREVLDEESLSGKVAKSMSSAVKARAERKSVKRLKKGIETATDIKQVAKGYIETSVGLEAAKMTAEDKVELEVQKTKLEIEKTKQDMEQLHQKQTQEQSPQPSRDEKYDKAAEEEKKRIAREAAIRMARIDDLRQRALEQVKWEQEIRRQYPEQAEEIIDKVKKILFYMGIDKWE